MYIYGLLICRRFSYSKNSNGVFSWNLMLHWMKKIFLYSYCPDHILKVNEIYSLLYGLFPFPVEFIIYMQNGFVTINAVNIEYVSVVNCFIFSSLSNKIYLWIHGRKMTMANGWAQKAHLRLFVSFCFLYSKWGKGNKNKIWTEHRLLQT